jgi:AmiR/NasT family two-component response regulator
VIEQQQIDDDRDDRHTAPQGLRIALGGANTQLLERKLIERAKVILMQQRKLTE